MDSPTSRRGGLIAVLATLVVGLGFAATAHATTSYNVAAGDATSLRDAIDSANSDGDDSIVNVPAGHYGLAHNGFFIGNDGSFTLVGAGARSTIIDMQADPGSGSSDTAFTIGSTDASFSGITVTGASVDGSGGAFSVVGGGPTPAAARGFEQTANLTISDSTISGNDAASAGGIYDAGNLTVLRSTFVNNTAAEEGAAISVDGLGNLQLPPPVVTITNSTFNSNTSGSANDGFGFGVITASFSSDFTLLNDTIAGNRNLNGNGSGGIAALGSEIDVQNTILANSAGPDGNTHVQNCFAGKAIVTSLGHNIESGTDCDFTAAGDQQNTDPKLGALGNNGGQMDTMAPQAGSTAIDRADASACPATDEIGTTRPQGPGCDIGAFEVPVQVQQQQTPPAAPPAPPPAKPAAPKIGVAGVRRACVSHSFHIRFHIVTASNVKRVVVKLDRRRIRSTKRGSFTLRINARKLKAGRHRLTITATDSAGQTTTSHRTFSVCKAAKPRRHLAPRFTG